jgi:uracil-DNA glycosylase
MALVRPRVVILFGKMAIEQILGLRTSLARLIGTEIERDGIWYLPLPHSSGASTWLNHREHQLLLEQAILLLAERRKETI